MPYWCGRLLPCTGLAHKRRSCCCCRCYNPRPFYSICRLRTSPPQARWPRQSPRRTQRHERRRSARASAAPTAGRRHAERRSYGARRAIRPPPIAEGARARAKGAHPRGWVGETPLVPRLVESQPGRSGSAAAENRCSTSTARHGTRYPQRHPRPERHLHPAGSAVDDRHPEAAAAASVSQCSRSAAASAASAEAAGAAAAKAAADAAAATSPQYL